MIRFERTVRHLAVAAAAASLAACAATPPPPVVEAPAQPPTPARPMAPQGAFVTMAIPPVDAMGVRQTINANISPAQQTWNLRSALNVAALNCQEPRHEPILTAYRMLLKDHAKVLASTSRTLDREFRDRYGVTGQSRRDIYNTQVYNYYALPPALPAFCDAALAVSNEMLATPPADLNVAAAQILPRFERVFEGFFRDFEQFRTDATAWDAQYGRYFGYTLPQQAVVEPAPTLPLGVPTPEAVPTAAADPAPAPAIVVPTTPATGSGT